jgi:hypothetical protein
LQKYVPIMAKADVAAAKAAADAWDEDRREALTMHFYAVENWEALVEARKRLEEAEKALRGFLEYEDPISGMSDIPSGPFDRAKAALAREEKP